MEYRKQIQLIRADFLHGRIDLDTAKKLVQPLLDEMNKKGAAIAKEHGKKFHKLSFSYVFR